MLLLRYPWMMTSLVVLYKLYCTYIASYCTSQPGSSPCHYPEKLPKRAAIELVCLLAWPIAVVWAATVV